MRLINRRGSSAGIFAAGAAALALVAAPLVADGFTSPAQAADATVLSSTFDDGTYTPWVVNGNATLSVVADPSGTGKSLEVSGRTHSYDGIALPTLPSLVQRDVAYTVSFKARLASADQPAGGVHFTVDDGKYTWVSSDGALTADAWTTITGTYTLPTGATPGKMYLDTSGTTFPDVLLDDITITGPGTGTGGGTGSGQTCTPTATSLVSADFSDSTLGTLQKSGGPTISFEQVDGNTAARVSGRANDFDGIQTASGALSSVAPGDVLTLSARVKLAGSTTATTSARLVVKPAYSWVGNSSAVSASGWTTLTGTYTVPAGADPTQLQVYLGSDALTDGTSTYDYYVDDVSITVPGAPCTGTGGGGGTGSTCDYPTSDTIISSDFENGADGWAGRDDGHGTATVAVVSGGYNSDHALSATNRQGQGQGVGHDVSCLLQAGTTYEFSGWVRFAAGQPTDGVWLSLASTVGGSTTYSTLGQFTTVTNTGWTQITQKFTMPQADSALLYIETAYKSGATGNTSDLLFDNLQVTKPAAATIQDITPIKDTLPFPVGAAVSSPELTGAPGQLLAKHFDQVTPENSMKPEAWYNADHSFVTTNADADAVMTFAQQNDMRVYGHNLSWYSQTPDWFFQDDQGNWLTNSAADQQTLRQRLHDHIFAVAKYLSDKFGLFGSATDPLVSFDVVNEAVSDNAGDPEGLRQSHWYQVLGESYIEDAFNDANEAFNQTYAASGAAHPIQLFINDYNTEQAGKRSRMQALITRLVADDVPVDGIGHQFHVTMSTPVSTLKDAIDAFAGIQSDGHQLYQAVTELDVPTGTPVTTANETDQGYYYKDVFDMLRAAQTKYGDIFSATVWGLTDGQSWRASSGAPLLFDDDLQAKPAYYGVTDQTLPAKQLSAIVFAQDASDVDVSTTGATSNVEWSQLPLKSVGDNAGFQLRWSADHLTAYVQVTDATNDATDAATFAWGSAPAATATVNRDGTVTGTGVTAQVSSTATGWKAVVDLPTSPALTQTSTPGFDVSVTDGTTTNDWNTPGSLGTLQLVEPLSTTTIPEAATAPTIDGTKDAAWAQASTVTTGKLLSGAAGGATATVYQLWKDNYLYVLADVTDPTIDTSSPNAYEQDSVEIFTDPGNAKNGSYRPDDAQMRIGVDNAHSFGAGDTEAAQEARLTSATSLTSTGYIVEARIDLKDGNTGVGAFEGLDYEVNDGTAGARTSDHGWAEPTGSAYQTTARWGVGQLAGVPTPPSVAPAVTAQPASISGLVGAVVSFTATASGTPTPTIQWQQHLATGGWTNIFGATSSTLKITVAKSLAGAQYRAVFTSTAGTATSSAATLTLLGVPSVTQQPKSATAVIGSNVSFTAKASGTPTPTVAWQRQLSGGQWTTVSGAKSTTLTVSASTTVNGAKYRAVFTNSAGQATSSAATLTLKKAAPKITSQPSSIVIKTGRTATFTVTALAYPAAHYRWYVQERNTSKWVPIGGDTSKLSLTASLKYYAAHFRVVVSNANGSVTSSTVRLTETR